ncbi:S41 family peptidase [Larkinella soli]|uniref:S41 family peptidase n=1 Tax=Larkinella soli TaxID=1770527 RepID=UPI000FFBCE8E|nr:S41 family peptidase [Larkinella soli]
MKALKLSLFLLVFGFLTGCEQVFIEKDPPNTPEKNFDVLWTTLKERYSFFAYKHIDWDSVYAVYRPRVTPQTTERELWNLMSDMLDVLRDGHVNLRSEFDLYYYNWYIDAPANFDRHLLDKSYWRDTERTGRMVNTLLKNGTVGYIYYGSFIQPITDAQLDYLADKFAGAQGVIIDIRNNEGGNPINGFRLGRRLADQRRHVYTTLYKNGPGPNDFTAPDEAYLEPSGKPLPKKVVILTNRTVYSAANFFTAMMKAFPGVTVVGDRTGGGGGSPVGWELPNGWSFNFSSSITYLPDGFIIENGVEPDLRVDQTEEDRLRGRDTLLERALSLF